MFDTQEDILEDIDGQSQLLSAALKASRSGVLITDWRLPDNPIIYCNNAFTEMTGYTLEEIKGKNCRFLQAADRDQIGRHKLQEAIQNEEACQAELANYRKDGTIFYNEVSVSPVRNRAGVVTHYIGIQNDITIRKLKETSLRLELAIAEKLQVKKDEFLCVASHELKTPMTSLNATLQLINQLIDKGAFADERIIHLSRHAERYARKLIWLVNELLDSSNILEGGLHLKKTEFYLDEIFDDCCNHLLLNGDYHLKFNTDCKVAIHADKSKVNNVITNLIENATKHAPESKEIIVDVISLPAKTKITVADRGPGVAPKDVARIFERYRDNDTDKGRLTGLGLGLFVSSEIIRRHGGEIGIDESYTDGAKFWFTIPKDCDV